MMGAKRVLTSVKEVGRFREGDRVALAIPGFFLDYRAEMGDKGTVIARNDSIYADPLKRLVWVRWDKTRVEEGVYRSHLRIVG